METDIFYKVGNDTIRVLESLLSIAHTVKRKALYESAQAEEKRKKKAALNLAEFQAEAVNIYRGGIKNTWKTAVMVKRASPFRR